METFCRWTHPSRFTFVKALLLIDIEIRHVHELQSIYSSRSVLHALVLLVVIDVIEHSRTLRVCSRQEKVDPTPSSKQFLGNIVSWWSKVPSIGLKLRSKDVSSGQNDVLSRPRRSEQCVKVRDLSVEDCMIGRCNFGQPFKLRCVMEIGAGSMINFSR
jgi:hypothetical protein